MYCSKPYLAACELQRLLLGKARDPLVKGAVLSGLARAFVEVEECKRKLRMKPLPKPIDVSREGKSKASGARKPSFSEQ